MEQEAHILELVRAGDAHQATDAALRWLGADVHRYLRSVLRDEDAAGEAFQRFAEALWKGLSGFRAEGTFRGWAFRLASNIALRLRADPWRRRVDPLSGQLSRLVQEIRTRSDERLARQQEAVDRVRAQLSEEERSLLALRVDHGMSWEQVAEVLAEDGEEVNAAALRKRFERVREKLVGLLREQGLLDDA